MSALFCAISVGKHSLARVHHTQVRLGRLGPYVNDAVPVCGGAIADECVDGGEAVDILEESLDFGGCCSLASWVVVSAGVAPAIGRETHNGHVPYTGKE